MRNKHHRSQQRWRRASGEESFMPNKIEIAVEILRASEAVKKTKKERAQSHREGLCLDCQAALGGNLAEMRNEAL